MISKGVWLIKICLARQITAFTSCIGTRNWNFWGVISKGVWLIKNISGQANHRLYFMYWHSKLGFGGVWLVKGCDQSTKNMNIVKINMECHWKFIENHNNSWTSIRNSLKMHWKSTCRWLNSQPLISRGGGLLIATRGYICIHVGCNCVCTSASTTYAFTRCLKYPLPMYCTWCKHMLLKASKASLWRPVVPK